MDTVSNFFGRYWRVLAVGLFLVVLSYVLLFRGLSTLTDGYSKTELLSREQSSSLSTILHQPANAPYKLLVWLGLKLNHHNLVVTRVAAALLAIGVAGLFYWVAVHWYSKRVSFLVSVLFVSSSGFLHFGRYGTALILQMATLLLISAVLLHRRSRHETLAAYLLAIILAICLYIPGFLWFELVGLLVLHTFIRQELAKMGSVHTGIISAIFVLLIVPLLWAGVHDLHVFRVVGGLPPAVPTIRTMFENALHLGSSIIYRGYWPPEYWLYGAPLLNIAEVVLFITGLIVLVRRPLLRQNYYLIGTLAVSTVLIILGGSVTIAMLVPLVYLTIAGGIFYLLDQWMTVFPRNPVARATGFTLILILATFSALYHLQAYYTAWPNSPETKAVYTIESQR